MTIRRQKINAGLPHIQRKNAQTLDRIHQQQGTVVVGEPSEFCHVNPPTARVSHPAHRHDPCVDVAGLGDPIQVHAPPRNGNTPCLNTSIRQIHPGVKI